MYVCLDGRDVFHTTEGNERRYLTRSLDLQGMNVMSRGCPELCQRPLVNTERQS